MTVKFLIDDISRSILTLNIQAIQVYLELHGWGNNVMSSIDVYLNCSLASSYLYPYS